MKPRISIIAGLLLLMVATRAPAQAGGTYDLGCNVAIASGGAIFSSGGAYTLGGTAGQVGVESLTVRKQEIYSY